MGNRPPYRHLILDTVDTTGIPIRRWRMLNSELVRIVAMIPPLLVLPNVKGVAFFGHGLIALLVVTIWQMMFARSRSQMPGPDLIATILLFVLMLPTPLTGWQLVLGVSFGVVVGEQLFGGRGYSFVHPVIAGLAFMLYSFPAAVAPLDHTSLSAALIPGLLLLLYYRLIDWRVLLGLVAGALAIRMIVSHDLPDSLPGTMVLAACLFAALDPAVGTTTRPGRWVYGFLIGALLVLFDPSMASLHAIVFACLLGSVAAPLIDWMVIKTVAHKERSHHG